LIDKALLNQVASLVFYPKNDNASKLISQAEELIQKRDRYVNAEFRELSRQYSNEASRLKGELEDIKKARMANNIAEKGYFIIEDPEWDYYYGRRRYQWGSSLKDQLHKRYERGLTPIRMINRYPHPLSRLAHRRALCSVPTNRFKTNVPGFVIERVLKEKEKDIFCSFDIFFVAKIGDINKMVREFVVDPILVGRWSVGKRFRDNGFMLSPILPRSDLTEKEIQELYDQYEELENTAHTELWQRDLLEFRAALEKNYYLMFL